jgi:hypothetical protein
MTDLLPNWRSSVVRRVRLISEVGGGFIHIGVGEEVALSEKIVGKVGGLSD